MLNLEIKCGEIGEGILCFNKFLEFYQSGGCYNLNNRFCKEEDFYINLDIVRKFKIKKLEHEIKITDDVYMSYPFGGEILPKYYDFTGIPDYIEFDLKGREELALLFYDEADFNRIKNILTEQLCIK